MTLPNPTLWSVEKPYLYTAIVRVKTNGIVRDAERIAFGVRTAVFDADKGFFLNGKPLKIQGTCNHQDHAGVGAALPDRLQAFRLGVLREMGCNAVRTSHNMPTPEWVEACDRMGMMMMCETRQMSSSPEGLAQLEAMVKRYRNSPSIILWSDRQRGVAIAERDGRGGRKDRRDHGSALPRARPHARGLGCGQWPKRKGRQRRARHHRLQLPTAISRRLSQEESHAAHLWLGDGQRDSRRAGVYSTDPLRNTESAYDVNQARWGETAEEWWKFYMAREWEAGGFAWTGFDYRGEPTPYGWPSINSQFGIVDMCGFPKDTFFYYKSWWGAEPVLHLFPHWNFEGREGDEIPVWVHSNLDEVELLVNGKSLGSQKVPRLGHVEWKVRYEPGTIEARGTKGRQGCACGKTRDDGPDRSDSADRRPVRNRCRWRRRGDSDGSRPLTGRAGPSRPPITSLVSRFPAMVR